MDCLMRLIARRSRGWIWIFVMIPLVLFSWQSICMNHASWGRRLESNNGLAFAAGSDIHLGSFQQASTDTPTSTSTPTGTTTGTTTGTATSTPTGTTTGTVTGSLSPSITGTQYTPSPSPSLTETPILSYTGTPDVIGTMIAVPTGIFTFTLEGPVGTATASATLIPFPNVTFESPQLTKTFVLNYRKNPPDETAFPKGNRLNDEVWRRFGVLVVIVAFWIGLAIWLLLTAVLDRE